MKEYNQRFRDLLKKYGTYCPKCGSGDVTSRNAEPMHRCLECAHRFTKDEAAIGKAAAEEVVRRCKLEAESREV